MNKSPLVSIIIPVYNGEKYLNKSIVSIYRQNYDNIEIIAVNDGSKDNSLRMLNNLKMSAPKNITWLLLNQENCGICVARNNGLDYANGKYIMFVDQDDALEQDAVQRLVNEIENKEADIVIGGFRLVSERGDILETWQLDPKAEFSPYRITAPWGRLFKKEIIDTNHIRFMITKISEDYYFNYLYLSYCKNIAITDYIGYRWTYRNSSESHKNMSVASSKRNPLKMLSQLMTDMNKPNNIPNDILEYSIFKHLVWYLFFVSKGMSRKTIKNSYNEIDNWLRLHFPDRKYLNQPFKFPRGESKKIRFIVQFSAMLERKHLFLPFLIVYSKF